MKEIFILVREPVLIVPCICGALPSVVAIDDRWQVQCANCGRAGSTSHSSRDAVSDWNRMVHI